MNKLASNVVVALTGSLGTGKSAAARAFAKLGARVVSADELARLAVDPATDQGRKNLAAITAIFGEAMLTSSGSLDRKALGRIIFADAAHRKQLEEILHPAIRTLAQSAFQNAIEAGAALVIYEVPLFFEAKLDREQFKCVVVVAAERELAANRVMERDGVSRTEALQRIDAQIPIAEKRALADYVLENSGSIEQLERAVAKLYQTLISRP